VLVFVGREYVALGIPQTSATIIAGFARLRYLHLYAVRDSSQCGGCGLRFLLADDKDLLAIVVLCGAENVPGQRWS
jgi:hypothetical protein